MCFSTKKGQLTALAQFVAEALTPLPFAGEYICSSGAINCGGPSAVAHRGNE